MASAPTITPGELTNEFSEPDRSHYYRFSAIGDSRYTFKPPLQTLPQSTLHLLDSDGREIETGTRFDAAASLRWIAPASGVYYLQVSGYSAGAYQLSMSQEIDDQAGQPVPISTPGI